MSVYITHVPGGQVFRFTWFLAENGQPMYCFFAVHLKVVVFFSGILVSKVLDPLFERRQQWSKKKRTFAWPFPCEYIVVLMYKWEGPSLELFPTAVTESDSTTFCHSETGLGGLASRAYPKCQAGSCYTVLKLRMGVCNDLQRTRLCSCLRHRLSYTKGPLNDNLLLLSLHWDDTAILLVRVPAICVAGGP